MDTLLNNFILNKPQFLKNVQKTNKSWDLDKLNNWPPTFLFQFADCEWPEHKDCISLLYKIYDDDEDDDDYEKPIEEISFGFKIGTITKDNKIIIDEAPYGGDTYEQSKVIKSVYWIRSNKIKNL